MAEAGEVEEGGGGVFCHAALVGVGARALAVAAVIEGEDVEAGVVEGGDGAELRGVGEGAVAAGEEEGGEVAGVWGAGGGKPESGELGRSGEVGGEADGFDEGAGDERRERVADGGVERELPLALKEEEAEGAVAAEEGDEDEEGYGFGEPGGIDVGEGGGRRWGGRAPGGRPGMRRGRGAGAGFGWHGDGNSFRM